MENFEEPLNNTPPQNNPPDEIHRCHICGTMYSFLHQYEFCVRIHRAELREQYEDQLRLLAIEKEIEELENRLQLNASPQNDPPRNNPPDEIYRCHLCGTERCVRFHSMKEHVDYLDQRMQYLKRLLLTVRNVSNVSNTDVSNVTHADMSNAV